MKRIEKLVSKIVAHSLLVTSIALIISIALLFNIKTAEDSHLEKLNDTSSTNNSIQILSQTDKMPNTVTNVENTMTAAPCVSDSAIVTCKLYFSLRGISLSIHSQSIFDAMVAQLAHKSLDQLFVISYTDTTGTEAYNESTSCKRSIVIADLLAKAFPDTSIIPIGLGEKHLPVNTSDEVIEPLNRVAIITNSNQLDEHAAHLCTN